MLQVNEYAKRYLCIKCYNEKETNEKKNTHQPT